MATWDTTYEALPPGTTETGSLGDDRIRSWKAEIGDRFDQEHVWMSTSSFGQTVHRKGAARTYYAATAPTLRPDATTALGTLDEGRLFVDSDVSEGAVWSGSAFAAIGGNAIVDQGGGTHLKLKILSLSGQAFGGAFDIAHGLDYTTIRKFFGFVSNTSTGIFETLRGHGGYTLIRTGFTDYIQVYVVPSYFTGNPDYAVSANNMIYVAVWYAEA
jgi:hypothetical protein